MGFTYDSKEQRFIFNFKEDNKEDTICLSGEGYMVEASASVCTMAMSFHKKQTNP